MKYPIRQSNIMTPDQWRAFIEERRIKGLDGEYKIVPALAVVVQSKAFRCDLFDEGKQQQVCERQCIVCRYVK